jgi:SAM-dependent methyltransferase
MSKTNESQDVEVKHMKAEFDLLADEYFTLHKKNVAITGESPEYFSEYKIADLAGLISRFKLPATNILDFGSGIGNSLPYLRKYFSESMITCADVSARSNEIARSRFPGRERYVQIDENIPLPSASQDVIFSACVFHHIPHEEHLHWLNELLRVTRPGGVLMIYEHNPLNPLTVYAVKTCPLDANAKLINGTDMRARMLNSGWSEAKLGYKLFFPAILSLLRPLEPRLEWLCLGAQYRIFAIKAES